MVIERLARWQNAFAVMDHRDSLQRHVYDEHAGPLVAFVLRLTNGDRQQAEDIVRQTILRAWRNADKFAGDGTRSLRPWLVTVARRIAIDGYRANGAHARQVPDPDFDLDASLGSDYPERIIDTMAINDALWTLQSVDREILTETYFCGRSVSDVADELGIPVSAAKSRVYYALRALREALDERGLAQYGD